MPSTSPEAAETVEGTSAESGSEIGADYDETGVKVKQEKIDSTKELEILWSAPPGVNTRPLRRKQEIIDLNEKVDVMALDSSAEDSSLDDSVGSKRAPMCDTPRSTKRSKSSGLHAFKLRPTVTPTKEKQTTLNFATHAYRSDDSVASADTTTMDHQRTSIKMSDELKAEYVGQQLSVSSSRYAKGRTPIEYITGETPDSRYYV